MKGKSPYDECPVYTSDHFRLRLVEEGDAADLLRCYSDESAVRLMNADNCTSDFHYRTIEEMVACIRDWLGAYGQRSYVRFSVIDTQDAKAVGTIEMYSGTGDASITIKGGGILRLDLCSAYEAQDYIRELLGLSIENFYDAFGVQQILTKAIPVAAERVAALCACGFTPLERNVRGHGDYYIR